MKLTTITRLKRHLGLPLSDLSKNDKLSMIIEGVSSFIEGQTARRLALQDYTLKLDGEGADIICLPHYPILLVDSEAAVTSVKIDGVEVDISTLDIDNETGIIYHPYRWPVGRRNIEISFSAGYVLPNSSESGQEDGELLPQDLELAAIRLAARVYERSTAEGVSSVSTDSFNANYREALDPDIEQIIARHAKARIT